jgi:3,4-dihydroxy 2-butanone 4-phosphate synthase/GTP cyclohydrolase II
MGDFKLNTIEEAIEDIRLGKIVIVVDDEDRENEGDFICAAESITSETINFMATHGRGLICTPIDERRAKELKLDMMVSSNTALHETAFTVSIDLIGQGCTTGISAYDRSTGIRAMVDPNTKAEDFARPGHIFPLIAKTGGVLRRTGHTEAAIDLARLAGFYPAGVLVEILNEDGTMARMSDLAGIAKKFDMKLITIKDLVEYRMSKERLVQREVSVNIDSFYGPLELVAFKQKTSGETHLAIKKGNWTKDEPVLVRVHRTNHYAAPLSDLLTSQGEVLDGALKLIEKEGKGIVLIMNQHEKDRDLVYLLNQIKDSKEKGEKPKLSFSMDDRDYGIGAQILNDLNLTKLKLITSKPTKRIGLIGYGLEIVENIPLKK